MTARRTHRRFSLQLICPKAEGSLVVVFAEFARVLEGAFMGHSFD
jgi:hypothetical protein